MALILVVAGILAALFVHYRRAMDQVDISFTPEKGEATLSLKRLRQTATKDGVKEWSLEAGSAQFSNSRKTALLKDVSVTFYPREGGAVLMTADRGILKIDSNDIEASGNVVVKRNDYRLRTEDLQYDHRRSMIYARKPVRISAGAMELTADSMSFDLNSRRAEFKGHVRGTIREKLSL